jgi:hypothetical protein
MVSNTEQQRRLVQKQRRRFTIMTLVREGHENQMSRMDDMELWTILLRLGVTVGRNQVRTMLQELEVLGYLEFKSAHNPESGELEISGIELTAPGVRFMDAGRSNDDILVG